MKVLAVAALSLGFATSAMAMCVDNCPDNGNGGSNNVSGNTLQVHGSSIIGGNVGSMFDANYGSNKVTKKGETKTDIESKLGGFCEGSDCSNTSLKINLMAMEQGSVQTTAGGEESGRELGLQNSGQFNAGTMAGIKFGGTTTEVQSTGAAAFGNLGLVKATGQHVKTDMKSYGSGGVKSTLKTQGDACPTCADFSGGVQAYAKSGMTLNSIASGGTSGQLVGIANQGKSTSATQVGTKFNQNSGQ